MCLRTTHKSRLYVTSSACDTTLGECHVYGVGFLADSWQQVLEEGATVSLECMWIEDVLQSGAHFRQDCLVLPPSIQE